MQRNTPADACETFEFGEVEDYGIQIIQGNNSNSDRTSYLNFAAFNAGRAVELQWLTNTVCLLYTSPSPRDATLSRMPSSA